MRRTPDPRRRTDLPGAPRPIASGGSGHSEPARRPLPSRWWSWSRRRRRSQLLPEREANEAADPEVLADRRDLLGDEIAHGALFVAEWLVEQADLREPLVQLAVDDLGPDVLGLLLRRGIREQLRPLRGDDV